ncbi:MAG TPA: peptidylprolyl isomerase [Desulfuromonadales bacterium]|nr:peptidylprolyl isomerase [Desulfuromonadales bacterium]
MNRPTLATVATILTLVLLGGCAANNAAVTRQPTEEALKAEQSSSSSDSSGKTKIITNAIVAVVNDEIITLYNVNREAEPAFTEAKKKAALTDAEKSQIRRMVLDRLIEKKLTEQKIKELNIKVSEDEIRQAIDDVRKQNNIPSQEALVVALAAQGLSFEQYRTQLQDQIEKLKLVSMEVRSKVYVGEGEMREYYTANLAKYSEDESFRARHIFFKSGEKATSEQIMQAKATAALVLAETRAGKDFVELAKKFSEDPAARKDGGDLGSFKKGDMQPDLEKAILSLKPGEVSDLISTPIGFHIIKLESRTSGTVKPFESVKGDIEEIIYRKKSEERFSQWAKELRGKATVEIRTLDGLL